MGLAIARVSAGDFTALIPIAQNLWSLGKGIYKKYKEYKANKAKRTGKAAQIGQSGNAWMVQRVHKGDALSQAASANPVFHRRHKKAQIDDHMGSFAQRAAANVSTLAVV